MITLHGLDDVRVYLVPNALRGHANRVAHRHWGTAAVGDDADAVDPEQRLAPIFIGTGFLANGQKRALREQGAELAYPTAANLVLQPGEDRPGERFGRLEHDIAGEPDGDDDFDRMFKNILSLDVAAKG